MAGWMDVCIVPLCVYWTVHQWVCLQTQIHPGSWRGTYRFPMWACSRGVGTGYKVAELPNCKWRDWPCGFVAGLGCFLENQRRVVDLTVMHRSRQRTGVPPPPVIAARRQQRSGCPRQRPRPTTPPSLLGSSLPCWDQPVSLAYGWRPSRHCNPAPASSTTQSHATSITSSISHPDNISKPPFAFLPTQARLPPRSSV